MGREYEPTVGQWYEDLENEETFQVLKVDEDREVVEIQFHVSGDDRFVLIVFVLVGDSLSSKPIAIEPAKITGIRLA